VRIEMNSNTHILNRAFTPSATSTSSFKMKFVLNNDKELNPQSRNRTNFISNQKSTPTKAFTSSWKSPLDFPPCSTECKRERRPVTPLTLININTLRGISNKECSPDKLYKPQLEAKVNLMEELATSGVSVFFETSQFSDFPTGDIKEALELDTLYSFSVDQSEQDHRGILTIIEESSL